MRLRVLANGDVTAIAVPVLWLLRYAYDVPVNPSPRLSGLPGWRETCDIKAKAPANAVASGLPEGEQRRRVQGMMRRLLADHFKLVMRVEQKQMSVYALTVASGGPNLQKLTIAEKDCAFDLKCLTPERCVVHAEALLLLRPTCCADAIPRQRLSHASLPGDSLTH